MKGSGKIGFRSGSMFLAMVLLVTVAACGQKSAQKAEQAKPQAAAPAAQPAPEPEKKAPEPVWPNPVPEGWVVVNDYETPADLSEPAIDPKTKKPIPKENKPTNLLGGEWGSIGFNDGKCALAQVKDGENTVLQVTYAMPAETSECGTFEYFMPTIEKKVGKKLVKNYPQFYDLRPFDKITAMVKSGDDKTHYLKLHVTELDPYGSQLQGYVSPTEMIIAGPDLTRVQLNLDKTLHEFFDRSHGKLTGFRIRFQEQPNRNDAGVVLFDNITFIKKGGN